MTAMTTTHLINVSSPRIRDSAAPFGVFRFPACPIRESLQPNNVIVVIHSSPLVDARPLSCRPFFSKMCDCRRGRRSLAENTDRDDAGATIRRESGHRSEILRLRYARIRAAARGDRQRLWFVLDVYQLHDFLPSAVPGLVFSFAWSDSEKKQAATVKGTERSRGRVVRARVAARPSGVHPQEAEWKDNAKALH